VKSHTSRSVASEWANSNLPDESTTFIWMKETNYNEQGTNTLSSERESVFSSGISPQVLDKCLADLTATMSGILRLAIEQKDQLCTEQESISYIFTFRVGFLQPSKQTSLFSKVQPIDLEAYQKWMGNYYVTHKEEIARLLASEEGDEDTVEWS